MVSTCCVQGCTSRSQSGNGVRFFRFPARDLERRRLWIRAVRREDWEPSISDRICGKHFILGEPNRLYRNHPDWIPSLFPFDNCSQEIAQWRLDRFERHQKRLKRFRYFNTGIPSSSTSSSDEACRRAHLLHAARRVAHKALNQNCGGMAEPSSRPSDSLLLDECSARENILALPFLGKPTPAFVVNSDGGLGSTCILNVPKFLLLNAARTPGTTIQGSPTNHTSGFLTSGLSPAPTAYTKTVTSRNAPIMHHVVSSTRIVPSPLERVEPESEESNQQEAQDIYITNVWSMALDASSLADEDEDGSGAVRTCSTDDQLLPSTDRDQELPPVTEQLDVPDSSAETSLLPQIVDVRSIAPDSACDY